MKTFKSIAALKAAAEKSARKTLENQVEEYLEVVIGDKANEYVYESYSPVLYERRGGLEDTFDHFWIGPYTMKIYDSEPANVSMEGYPAPPPGYLAQWINDTGVPNIFNNRDYVWMHPRPFYDAAIAELNSSSELEGIVRAGFIANL